MLKSRNMMLISAILFLIVVIALRLMGGVFEDSFLGIINVAFGERAEDIPLIDWSSLSWMNPVNWSVEEFKETINNWMHNVVDSIFPALIYAFHITTLQVILYLRTDIAGTLFSVGKWVSSVP